MVGYGSQTPADYNTPATLRHYQYDTPNNQMVCDQTCITSVDYGESRDVN